MNASLDLVFGGYALDERAVANTPAIERHGLIHGGPMAAHEVVEHHHRLALGSQPFHGHTADVTCSTRYENCHPAPSVLISALINDRCKSAAPIPGNADSRDSRRRVSSASPEASRHNLACAVRSPF